MGRVSQKLKARRVKAKSQTVIESTTTPYYYLFKVKKGETAPPGWVSHAYYRDSFSGETVKSYIDGFKTGTYKKQPAYKCLYQGEWFLYPGPKPDPEWGEVSP